MVAQALGRSVRRVALNLTYAQPHLILHRFELIFSSAPQLQDSIQTGSPVYRAEILQASLPSKPRLSLAPARYHGNLNLLAEARPHLPDLFLHRNPYGIQCVSLFPLFPPHHWLPPPSRSPPRCPLTSTILMQVTC